MLHGNADEPSSVINARTDNPDSRFGSEHNSKINAYAKSPWNDENTAYLKEKWLAGSSAGVIAAHFGMTRNAVIGRIHRLGLEREVPFEFWSDEETAQLRTLWSQNLTGGQIALQLSRRLNGKHLSKTAVHHKAKQIGLPNRVRSVESYRAKSCRGTHRNPQKNVRKTVPFATVIDTDIPIEQRRTFAQLEPRECKWPIGDPGTPAFFFCGGKAYETGPYCSAHHHRAFGYTPTKKFSGFRF